MKSIDPLTMRLEDEHLVEASAGTGKTYTLATLYLRLILEANLSPREILVVTYTNAATAELRARIRQRLTLALTAFRDGEAADQMLDRLVRERRATLASDRGKLTGALYAFDEAAIFTIHGFCQRVLLEHAFESGASFECDLLTDQTTIVDEIVRDFWARELYEAPEPLVRSVLESRAPLQAFAALVEKIASQQDVPVLPSAAPDDVDAVLAKWQSAYRSVLEIWATDRDEAVDLLHRSCGGLKRNSYPPDKIAGWAETVDGELARGRPGILKRFPQFTRFARGTLVTGAKKNCDPPAHRLFDACETLVSTEQRLAEELARRRLGLDLDLLAYARHELARRKEASNVQFFDDLLYRLDEALGRSDGALLAERLLRRFPAALIDEFQDTDPVQYRIFRRLYHGRKGSTLVLVGDPKQAIYAFRGADVFAYIEAKRDAGEKTHTLAVNRRADPALMRALNALFGNARRPFLLREIPFVPGEAMDGARDRLEVGDAPIVPLEVLFLPRDGKAGAKNIGKGAAETALPDAIAREISHFLGRTPTIDGRMVQPSDIAVLCRTNKQAVDMQLALRRLRVPSVLLGDASVFDAPEASQLEQVLRAMAEPGDSAALRAALATPLMGKTATELLALEDDERDWEVWAERFEHWHEIWLRNGFIPALRRMLDDCDVAASLLRLVDGERRLTNLLHLGELLQTAVREAKRGPLALVEWLREMRTDVRLRAEVGGEAAQMRLESDREALQLTTVHKSKGLEYPIVYCPFFWDGRRLSKEETKSVRFHDPEDDYRLKFDLGSPDHARHCELAEYEALAENLRLLYVAVTRARHRCTLVWGAVYQPEHSALGYLLHQPTGADENISPEAVAARIQDLDDESMRRDLDRFVDASANAIEVRDLATRPGVPYALPTTEPTPLHGRTVKRSLPRTWRVGSFSSLIAQPHMAHLSREAEEGVDHDEDVASMGDAAPLRRNTVVLHDFPAGVRPGRLVHEILERLDFTDADPTTVRRQVDTTMQRHGFDSAGADALTQAIEDVLATPLVEGNPPLRLRRIARHRRLDEMEFVFPVAHASARASTFDSGKLADVLARHAGAQLPSDYVDQVRSLGFAPLSGYLKGYIDLIFEQDDRWYVVDYKSNLLGAGIRDYEPARLRVAMQQHHYHLQSYLYAVAVHRYLALRLPGYDYDRHFGGTLYLFLRGMAPAYPPGNGIHRDRPPRALIEGLSELLADPARGEASRDD